MIKKLPLILANPDPCSREWLCSKFTGQESRHQSDFFKYVLMWTAENSPDYAGQLLEGWESLISCHFRAKLMGASGGDNKGIR